MILIKVFLYVASFYVSIFIFNMINNKRAFDIVFGAHSLNWKLFKILFKQQLYAPTKWFLYEFVLGMNNFEIMVKATEYSKRRMEQKRARN